MRRGLMAVGFVAAALLLAAAPVQAGYRDGNSRYEFEKSNPVNGLDPMGLETYIVYDPSKANQSSGEEDPKRKNPDGTPYIMTKMESSQRNADAYNRQIELGVQSANKENPNRKGFVLIVDGIRTQVSKDEYIKTLENQRVVVLALPEGKSEAIKKLKEIASKSKTDHVVYETHTVYMKVNGKSQPVGIRVGGDVVMKDDIVPTVAKSLKGSQAKLVFGSCDMSEEIVRDVSNESGVPVAGSTGTHHTIYAPLHPHKELIGSTQDFLQTLEIQTPYALQAFQKSPEPQKGENP